MRELLPLLLILFAVVSALSKKKTPQKAANPKAEKKAAEARSQVSSAPAQTERPDRAPLTATLTPSLHDHSDMYAGSMGDLEDEGYDPHDHGFAAAPDMPSMHSEEEINASLTAEETEGERGGFRLSLDGNSLMQAFVLQEVLKRPAERKR